MNVATDMRDLSIAGLSVSGGAGPIVRDVTLSVRPGQPLTLLGESGSGKSLVAQAVMGSLPPGLTASGYIRLAGIDLLAAPAAVRRKSWGRTISLLPQEPWLALDPTMRIAGQVVEVHRFVHGRSAQESRLRAGENLAEVGLDRAGTLYPFQMSGGMCQRAAIAITHASDSALLIADEPTKGLDAALRDGVVERLKQEIAAGRLVFTITHDVAVAGALGGMIGVMLDGRLVDYGPAEEVLSAPTHPYTKALLAADPATWQRRVPTQAGAPVVTGRALAKAYGGRSLFEGLDIEVSAGEIVAVVGPSGCGKTTLGNILLGLAPADSGSVERQGGVPSVRFQKLYQDPPAAFAPHQTIRRALADLARLHGLPWDKAAALIARLRLGEHLLDRRPGEISGGELQRFALARALLLDPVFLFADEATSRLDPVSQKEVVELLLEIVRDTGLAVLLVTHDGALADKIADRAVLLD
ncbi:ABC transporter ATP-binding protein [Chelatococcus sp. CO-6]|uniref:ABC transporter ATP-binding protein n=1 Tax=Chelatococcus sp. CO-6 TaxID=1702325 RepID=UPI00069E0ADB|nr:ATP-binding cassette domain-containing protein [Chelatococcus sp. CO-6]ALA16936.1 ABC transporter ATP-binding protein [Chelatococcus sp. CO-6]